MRDKYIKMRNSGKLDINWFYQYYRKEEGKADPQTFFDIFEYEVQKVQVPGGFIENRVPRNKQTILEHLDKKFELTILYSKEGQFLKIVE
jgi:hypothetical protein